MRLLALVSALALCACGHGPEPSVREYGYKVVHAYPHDPEAFTEGLFYLDGYLYESTGLEGHSSVRKARLETGEVVEKHDLPPEYFGEGIINWKNDLIQLTYKSEKGFVYDLATFGVKRMFEYPGEGWALTEDGKQIIMSDGTPQIRFWNPETLAETARVTVTDNGQPVKNVNELEYVKGDLYANIWTTDRIAIINPATGAVKGWIDLTGLLDASERASGQVDVLNGIAYDAKGDRLFVTGKKWPKLFEIKLVARD
jgi:glutaminyl-peptide cyclotransferase